MRPWPPGCVGNIAGSSVVSERLCIGLAGSRGGTRNCSLSGSSASDRRLDRRSRMKRECHVRFCEGLGVKLPGATRLVILCRRGKAEEALQRTREIMARLKLTVNEEKTRICKV